MTKKILLERSLGFKILRACIFSFEFKGIFLGPRIRIKLPGIRKITPKIRSEFIFLPVNQKYIHLYPSISTKQIKMSCVILRCSPSLEHNVYLSRIQEISGKLSSRESA